MTVVRSIQEGLNAVFEEGRVPAHYGRAETAHRAVRNVVGVTECDYGVVVVEGDDRVEYVDNVVSNRVPATDGHGRYALLLDPQGKIETDLYVYNAAESGRLLVFTPPDAAEGLAADWAEKTFIQDVEISVATGEFGVFGVHGPKATEKIASVLNRAAAPEERLSFVRGRIHDRGVTVIRSDDPPGEEGYEVICTADAAPEVFDTLVNHGLNAAPFGRRTWETLTLEAGTPLFEADLRGRLPNVLGLRNALDFEKGCYVGQEVVSRVENRGRPSARLVGLRLTDGADATGAGDSLPASGAAVFAGDESVGEVTRAAASPSLGDRIALAVVDFDLSETELAVRVGGEEVDATRVELPFVEGSARSARLPTYPGEE